MCSILHISRKMVKALLCSDADGIYADFEFFGEKITFPALKLVQCEFSLAGFRLILF